MYYGYQGRPPEEIRFLSRYYPRFTSVNGDEGVFKPIETLTIAAKSEAFIRYVNAFPRIAERLQRGFPRWPISRMFDTVVVLSEYNLGFSKFGFSIPILEIAVPLYDVWKYGSELLKYAIKQLEMSTIDDFDMFLQTVHQVALKLGIEISASFDGVDFTVINNSDIALSRSNYHDRQEALKRAQRIRMSDREIQIILSQAQH